MLPALAVAWLAVGAVAVLVMHRPRRTSHVGARGVAKKPAAGASVPVLVGPSIS